MTNFETHLSRNMSIISKQKLIEESANVQLYAVIPSTLRYENYASPDKKVYTIQIVHFFLYLSSYLIIYRLPPCLQCLNLETSKLDIMHS